MKKQQEQHATAAAPVAVPRRSPWAMFWCWALGHKLPPSEGEHALRLVRCRRCGGLERVEGKK